jgi:hypothetical protein
MDAFAQLGQIFQNSSGGANWGNIAKTGLTGFGLIGNILAQQKQNAALNRIAYYQKNPAAAAQQINSLTQPLSQGLTQDVGNNVQGYLAERGLSGSPNVTAEVLAQALAPYQQQNQQTATQEFMSLLNPAGATYGKPGDLSSLLKLWSPATAISSPTAGPGGQAYNPIYGGQPGTPPTFNLPSNNPGAPPDIDASPGLDLFGSY